MPRPTCRATLEFDTGAGPVQDGLTDLLAAILGDQGNAVACPAPSGTGACAVMPDARVSLQPEARDHGSQLVLTFEATAAGLTEDAACARLAGLTYHLLRHTGAVRVLWLDVTDPLPREAFLAALEPQLGSSAPGIVAAPTNAGTQAAAPCPARPRRVRLTTPTARTRRPVAADTLGLAHPFAGAPEARLRHALTRTATPDELRAERDLRRTEARRVKWSGPLNAGAQTPQTLVRREAIRAASLALALAGLFLAIDTTEAMAAVMRIL